jgi:hypothetical protein
MDDILERVDRVEKQIATIKNKVAYRDLRKMLLPIDHTITAMSMEEVECRQRKKITPKYRELEAKLNDLLSNLEQMVTFAALIG